MTRQQVMREKEQSQEQVSQISVSEQLKTLAQEFAKWSTKQASNKEAVDVEFKEVNENAVPKEREEGLQTGTPMGAQYPPESGEGTGREELSAENNGESREST